MTLALLTSVVLMKDTLALQSVPPEAAAFYAAYPDAQFSPMFRESLETFLRVEQAYKSSEYKKADDLLSAFWRKYPPGTDVWATGYQDCVQTSQKVGVNIGHPSCYYALRMFTECVEWKLSAKPLPKNPHTAVLTVVLVGKASGIEPRTRAELEAGEGTKIDLSLEKRLLNDNNKIVRDSTWLFEEYMTAATHGALKVKLNVLSLPDLSVPVQTTWQDRGFSGLSGDAWTRIWDSVPVSQKRQTDWWWVVYPSAVPDRHADFKKSEFVTGGMGVGPDGASPCFIVDDKWLTRRPPHLGQGTYTDLERRAYLPQWFQHEFFHHLFRIYPEHKLEVEGHDWFDKSRWPDDFEGFLEPDYYAEALKRRFKGSVPSLAVRLLYAPPSPDVLAKISVSALIGEYRHEPEQNGWHRGSITADTDQPGRLRWTNSAGASWLLAPDISGGVLETGPDCPYYPESRYFTLVLERDREGRHTSKVVGFNFGGSFYRFSSNASVKLSS